MLKNVIEVDCEIVSQLVIRKRSDWRKFAAVEVQPGDLDSRTVTRFLWFQKLLPHAVLGVSQHDAAPLNFCVHFQQQLVPGVLGGCHSKFIRVKH